MKEYCEVAALGELLVDFTQNGLSSQGNVLYEANPGGAPCNVLAMLQQLGHKTGFIGKLGLDIFGKQLRETVGQIGIDTSGIVFDPQIRTTLAFVQTSADGDRDFSFYRNPGADVFLHPDEVDYEMIQGAKIFHFGSLSMTAEPARSATIKALKTAEESHTLISFDPNLREPLWNSLEEAREQISYGIRRCDILKISDNELLWYTGEKDFDTAVEVLKEETSAQLILLTLGRDGSRAYYKNECIRAESFIQESTIDTTGAGDTFYGTCLHFVLSHGLRHLDHEIIHEMLLTANAAASIITTSKGALSVMPDWAQINVLLNTV